MRPFTEGDPGRFFGREVELDNIEYRLRHGEREIYVIGASGSGKSSLVAAGLVPRLTRGIESLSRFVVRSFGPVSGHSNGSPERSRAMLPRPPPRLGSC
jgi:ABC-type phosphonate transport system ATPase subunit